MNAFRFPHDVEGYLEPAEGEFLYRLARHAPKGPAVELGTYKGRSAICIAQARLLTCVDHFGGEQFTNGGAPVHADHLAGGYRPALIANLTRYDIFNVGVIDSDTSVAAGHWGPGTVALLFIDAAHDWPSVKRDVEAWYDRMLPKGVIAFHDRAFEGPAMAIDSLVFDHGWQRLDGPGSVAVCMRPR